MAVTMKKINYHKLPDRTTPITDNGNTGLNTLQQNIEDAIPTKVSQLTNDSGYKTTDTTYTFATGDNNGQVKVTPSGGTAQNVSVKGLGNSAYTSTTTSATSGSGSLITSGGVYNAINGKLIDSSGTNWIRYQDGTQICWGSIEKSNIAITTPWGTMYESPSISLGNFPKAFKTNTTPQLFVQCANGYSVSPEMVQPSATSLGNCNFYRPTSVSSATFTIFYLAIGKWK